MQLTAGPVPAAMDLVAYRVVQESITNARKHASGGAVRVRLAGRDGGLDVEVTNGPGREDLAARGPGHGLVGMRERVGLYAGTLDAGPTADGGWRVHAVLPSPAGGHS